MTGTYGSEEKPSRRVLRGQIIFQREKLKLFSSLFHSVYLVFFNTFDFYC